MSEDDLNDPSMLAAVKKLLRDNQLKQGRIIAGKSLDGIIERANTTLPITLDIVRTVSPQIESILEPLYRDIISDVWKTAKGQPLANVVKMAGERGLYALTDKTSKEWKRAKDQLEAEAQARKLQILDAHYDALIVVTFGGASQAVQKRVFVDYLRQQGVPEVALQAAKLVDQNSDSSPAASPERSKVTALTSRRKKPPENKR